MFKFLENVLSKIDNFLNTIEEVLDDIGDCVFGEEQTRLPCVDDFMKGLEEQLQNHKLKHVPEVVALDQGQDIAISNIIPQSRELYPEDSEYCIVRYSDEVG